MRPTRKLVCSHLRSTCPDAAAILDIGCGTGQLALELSALYPHAEITGADYSKGMIEMAIKKNNAPNILYINGSLEELPPGKLYDIIVSTHSFPYFPDKPKTAGELIALLKPGGRLIIVQGNNNNLYDAIWLFFVHLTVSKGRFLSVKKLKKILDKAGFTPGRIQRIRPAFWMPSVYMVEGINNHQLTDHP